MGWADDKGLTPWEGGSGPWAKNPGSWPFVERGNVFGYLNNPRWTDEPEAPVDYTGRESEEPQIWTPDGGGQFVSGSPEHKPCGHWHKVSGVAPGLVDVDIFVLHWFGFYTMIGAHFDGSKLSYVGYYTSAVDINGLILIDGDLLIVAGNGDTSHLESVTTYAVGGEFLLIHDYNIFNQYDIIDNTTGMLISIGDKFYYMDRSGVGVRITNTFAREARGFHKTVTIGTDGNLYRTTYALNRWISDYHPITGRFWSDMWDIIPDNICDSHITEWAVDPMDTDHSSRMDATYHSGKLYTVDWSSYFSPIRRINPSSMEVEKVYKSVYGMRITAKGSRIFVCGGVTSATVYAFDLDLTLLDSVALPFGRIVDGDVEIVGDYLIVSTTQYGSSKGALYKINPDTLNILDSIEDTDGELWQRLENINDQFVAVGRNSGICVFDINAMSLIDDLESPSSEYQLGYKSQAIVVKHN